jgi:complement component 1 Q subcomponent-binding protein
LEESAQGDYVRQDAYGGPVFEQLDPELQDKFASFLSERGFDEALAEFIPAFVEAKEQSEYIRWLGKVGEFVSK